VDDVLLATSELVTNAILHGGGTVVVTVWPGRDGLRVQVADDGGTSPQPNRDHPGDEESGRGLFIVDALTARWGVIPKTDGPGKTVWVEFLEESRPAREASPVTSRWPFNTAAATPSHCFSILWNPVPESGIL
jgi:hypothetical protein